MQHAATPNFIEIMHQCQQKMEESFPKYGNSWLHFNGLEFWKKRLDGEIDEVWKAKTFEDYQKEIQDAINILAMMHDRYDDWFFSEGFRDKQFWEPCTVCGKVMVDTRKWIECDDCFDY